MNCPRCVQTEDAEPLSKKILEALSDKAPSKTCNTAAQFLILYGAHLSDQMLQQIYGRLMSIKNSKKALQTIDNEPFLVEKLGKTIEIEENLTLVGQRVTALLLGEKKTTDSLMTAIKKEFAITQKDLPAIKDKEGEKVEPFVFAFLLVTGRVDSRLPSEEEKEVTAMLDQESFMAGLSTLADSFIGLKGVSNKRFLIYPICRYANEELIQCDAEIQEDIVIKNRDEFKAYLKSMKIRGLGGTDFRPVFKYVDQLIREKAFRNLKGMKLQQSV